MSKNRNVKINCPECGAEGEFTLWESVNKQLSPKIAEKVRSGELFKWTCPKCGQTFTVPYPMLYHDMDKSFMVYLLTSRLDPADGKLTKYGIFQHEYTYRSVFEIDDLREKISIFEDGLDDRAVELVKYIFTHQQRPKDIPEDTVLRYIGKIEGKGMMLQCIHESLENHPTMVVPFEMYDGMIADGLHEKIFTQNEDFPEVTQDYLREIMSSRSAKGGK